VPPPDFGTGTALTVNFVIATVGSAAVETAGRLRAMRPSTPRQIDALSIRFSLLC
jgi:hypothetical protein